MQKVSSTFTYVTQKIYLYRDFITNDIKNIVIIRNTNVIKNIDVNKNIDVIKTLIIQNVGLTMATRVRKGGHEAVER